MPIEECKPGIKVRVISGGPIMTVSQTGERALTGEPGVWCVWFVGTRKFEDTFSPDVLEAVS